jgi:hypothetical protein
VWGTKRILLHTRNGGSVDAGLDYVALHNSAFLLSEDIGHILEAGRATQRPVFSKL